MGEVKDKVLVFNFSGKRVRLNGRTVSRKFMQDYVNRLSTRQGFHIPRTGVYPNVAKAFRTYLENHLWEILEKKGEVILINK